MDKLQALEEIIKSNKKPYEKYSNFATYMDIWHDIAAQINSTKGKDQKFWGNVMDLFKNTYSDYHSIELVNKTQWTSKKN